MHVEDAEDDREGGLGGGLAAQETEEVCQGRAFVTAELGDGLVALGPREHGEDGEGEDGGERVASAVTRAGVGNLGKDLEQGKGGRHPTDLLASEIVLPRLPSPSLLAKTNLQTALSDSVRESRP